MNKGRFITLEGGDGAGKSTQVKRLVESLRARGIEAIATREVGGAPGAEEIRELWLSKPDGFWDPMTEVMLIMAARREHIARTIEPALKRGLWVISDRYVDSTRVYQGIGLGLGLEKIDAVYHGIAGDFWPDLTLYLDLDVETGFKRMRARAGNLDRYESRNVSFHETLRKAFLDLARAEPNRFRVIDAAKSEDKVAKQIEEVLGGYMDAALM